MRSRIFTAAVGGLIVVLRPPAFGQGIPAGDSGRVLVGRLDRDRYKATIKSLTEFGDRRQGTDRNRAAIDWIEHQLKSFGCNTARVKYEYSAPEPQFRLKSRAPIPVASGEIRAGSGGSRIRGIAVPTGVNDDPEAQPDAKLRELDSQPSTPGPREEVYCTKIGATRPDEMYIISAHMDGIGWGEAANDNGSGTALVIELARVLNSPDVRAERSIRFALWNNEETGLHGARAYVTQRAALQGIEDPPGSGRYPEPKWLGMVQHDMVLFDHGMPRADGTLSPEQRPEADVNVEFQSTAKFADQAMRLAFFFRDAHAIVMGMRDKLAFRIHGLLHRIEGDLVNARYWYDRAAVPFRKSKSAASEIEEIAAMLERRAPVTRPRASSATRTGTRRSRPR